MVPLGLPVAGSQHHPITWGILVTSFLEHANQRVNRTTHQRVVAVAETEQVRLGSQQSQTAIPGRCDAAIYWVLHHSTRLSAAYVRRTPCVPSVDPSSTTIRSRAGYCCPNTLSIARPTRAARWYVATMIVTCGRFRPGGSVLTSTVCIEMPGQTWCRAEGHNLTSRHVAFRPLSSVAQFDHSCRGP